MPLAQLGAAWTPYLERVLGALAPNLAGREAFLPAAAELLDLTVAWNAKLDLTAAKTPDELVDLTFSDAAALVGAGHLARGGTWLDVGSGGGAPGLPLALLAPQAQVTLLEPMQKRVSFLRTAAGTLRVPVQIVRGRSEQRAAQSTEVAISRATLPPGEWLKEGGRLATSEVWVLLAREAPPALPSWNVHHDFSCTWPLTGRERRFVGFRKG